MNTNLAKLPINALSQPMNTQSGLNQVVFTNPQMPMQPLGQINIDRNGTNDAPEEMDEEAKRAELLAGMPEYPTNNTL